MYNDGVGLYKTQVGAEKFNPMIIGFNCGVRILLVVELYNDITFSVTSLKSTDVVHIKRCFVCGV